MKEQIAMTHHTNNLVLSRQQKQQQKPAPETRRAGGFGAKAEALKAQRFGDLAELESYEVMPDGVGAVACYVSRQGKPSARGFRGRALRAAFRYSFASAEHRARWLADWTKDEAQRIEEIQKRMAKEKQPHGYQVGDILYSCWGWEQTNINFYEVVAVRGAVVDIVELRQDREPTLPMQGWCMPRKGDHRGEVLKSKRPNGFGRVRIDDVQSAGRWDGSRMNWSSYA